MATRPILLYPDAKLFDRSYTVDPLADSTRELAADLVETMKANNGVGLSAIQVGAQSRVIVICGLTEKDEPVVMVNPKWWFLQDSQKVMVKEGCLSFPGIFEEMERYDTVVASWSDLAAGARQEQQFFGLQAQVIQHETEHLEGGLLIDHLPLHRRERIQLQMKRFKRMNRKVEKLVRFLPEEHPLKVLHKTGKLGLK